MLARLFAAPYKRRAPVLAGPRARRPARVRAPGSNALAELARAAGRAGPAWTAGAWSEVLDGAAASTWATTRSRTGCTWRAPRRSAPAASRRCWCWGSRRASSRAASRPGALPARRRAPRGGQGERTGAPAAGGPARPRALPLLRVRLARGAPAGAELAHERRGGHARGALLLPGRRERSCSSGRPRRVRSLGEVTWTPEEAPTAAEWDRALAARGPRREERAARARSTAAPLLADAGRARAAVRRAGWSASRTARSSGWWRACCGPRRSSPTPSRWCAALAHAVLERTFRRLRRRDGRPARHAREPRASAERILLEELDAPQLAIPHLPEPDARARRRAPARVRPAAPPRGARPSRRDLRAAEPRAPLRARARTEHGPVEIGEGCSSAGGSTGWTLGRAWPW